jgi:hypothetical protein
MAVNFACLNIMIALSLSAIYRSNQARGLANPSACP